MKEREMPGPRHDNDDWEVSPAEQLDEAFALLRSLPSDSWVWCLAGPVPLVLGGLFFWSDVTRGGQPVFSAAGWAVVMAGLYGWLKVTQAFFARSVWARLVPEGGLVSLTPGEWFRRTGVLLVHGVLSLPAQAVAAVLLVPFGWVHAFFHQSVVLAYTQELGRRPLSRLTVLSARVAQHEPMGYHFSLVLLVVLGGMVWGSVFAAGLLGPYLLKILTGVESEFTRNPVASAFNSLYLSATVGVSWLLVSPYFRVFSVWRGFRYLSRRTGDDLLARLQAERVKAGVSAAVVAGCVFLAGPWLAAAEVVEDRPVSTVVSAEEGRGQAAAVSDRSGAGGDAESEQWGEAIRRTLGGREYQWRLPPEAGPEGRLEESRWWAGVKRGLGRVRDGWRDAGALIREVRGALRRFSGGGGGSGGSGAGSGERVGLLLRVGLFSLGGLGLGGLGWLLWRWRRGRRLAAGSVAAAADGTGAIEALTVADEGALAGAWPEAEWLRLARERLEAGDMRMAVRALFLATLASLHERRLIELGRSKSNRDYAAEVRMRAVGRGEAAEIFMRSLGVFERVWYGWHDVRPAWVEELRDNHNHLQAYGSAV